MVFNVDILFLNERLSTYSSSPEVMTLIVDCGLFCIHLSLSKSTLHNPGIDLSKIQRCAVDTVVDQQAAN